MKSRLQMNRKRHHHLTERWEEDLQLDVKHPDRGQGHLRLLKSQVLLYHNVILVSSIFSHRRLHDFLEQL